MTPLLPLVVAFAAVPLVMLAGALRRVAAPFVAAVFAALSFAATLWGWLAGGGTFDMAWAPTWGLRLSFALDGLAALYVLLATGIGCAVIVYSACYLPAYLEHQERSPDEATRFYALLMLFMAAMIGLALAQDLLVLFTFWDLTAITSYYLIGYDRQRAEARDAALMALIVTGVTAMCFLLGALMLYVDYGTFSLSTLFDRVRPGPRLTVAGGLIVLAALAKSAQIPFHFWLPRAMAAPTPVSAYLHSAAMVAAGMLLIGKVYPLVQLSPILVDALLAVGLVTMAVGGTLALTHDVLKQVLAYSTIAQYGYVVAMFGLGGKPGVAGTAFYVLAHALAKSALFLTAGAVTEATGEDQLSRLGGLWRRTPLLAASSGVAAAALAAAPLTLGFFKDELLFAAALERGLLFAAFAVVSAALTLAYIWRFWSSIFLGRLQGEPQQIPAALVVPIALLALLIVAGGIAPGPFAHLAQDAASITIGSSTRLDLAYHFDARPENLLALSTYILGGVLIVSRPVWEALAQQPARLGQRWGPERWYITGLHWLNRFSRRLLAVEVRGLRSRIATVLVPAAILVAVGLLATPTRSAYRVGVITLADLPLLLILSLAAITGVAVTRPTNHLTLVLALSGVGYSLGVVYAFMGAPDVALVAVLVETILTLLYLGVFVLFPRDTLEGQSTRPIQEEFRWRDPLVGVVAGGFAFAAVWATLSRPAAQESVAVEQARLVGAAHANDIVTAILSDFRGLDTLGEMTVIAIVMLGITALIRLRKLRP